MKRFYELQDGFKKLLSIILIGQTELENKLAAPKVNAALIAAVVREA